MLHTVDGALSTSVRQSRVGRGLCKPAQSRRWCTSRRVTVQRPEATTPLATNARNCSLRYRAARHVARRRGGLGTRRAGLLGWMAACVSPCWRRVGRAGVDIGVRVRHTLRRMGRRRELVTATEIARRLGVSRAAPTMWAARYADYPGPVSELCDGWVIVGVGDSLRPWDAVLAWWRGKNLAGVDPERQPAQGGQRPT